MNSFWIRVEPMYRHDWYLHSAYSTQTHEHPAYLIGPPELAYKLTKLGIQPDKPLKKNQPSRTGYSVKDGKYYAWSRKRIFGFQLGDEIFNPAPKQRVMKDLSRCGGKNPRIIRNRADMQKAAVNLTKYYDKLRHEEIPHSTRVSA